VTLLPTGRQFVLTHGEDRVTVAEVGAALRSYVADGRELLDGWAEDEMPTGFRGSVLAPWPNRLRDGRYTWEGVEHQTALTEPETATALHGLITHAAFSPVAQADDRVELEHLLHPRPGYPFALRLRVTYALTGSGLQVTTEAVNVGRAPLPYGEGHHPYLTAGGLVDRCELVAPAGSYVVADDRGLPVQTRPVDGTAYDFRSGRRVGEARLDHAFTDLERDEAGLAWVRLTGPDGRGAAVWLDESYRWLMLFTGDTVPDVERRRRGLGVEPMTCPPDAFRTGEGVRRLEPGKSASGAWGIVPSA
jgi:aldose 1-epimerase